MKQTPAQHQRELDNHGEIERIQWRIEDEMREELIAGRYIEIRYRRNVAIVRPTYDNDDVINAMVDLDSDEFNDAVLQASSEPMKAAVRLHALRVRAVDHLIGEAETWDAAVHEFYEAERKAA